MWDPDIVYTCVHQCICRSLSFLSLKVKLWKLTYRSFNHRNCCQSSFFYRLYSFISSLHQQIYLSLLRQMLSGSKIISLLDMTPWSSLFSSLSLSLWALYASHSKVVGSCKVQAFKHCNQNWTIHTEVQSTLLNSRPSRRATMSVHIIFHYSNQALTYFSSKIYGTKMIEFLVIDGSIHNMYRARKEKALVFFHLMLVQEVISTHAAYKTHWVYSSTL